MCGVRRHWLLPLTRRDRLVLPPKAMVIDYLDHFIPAMISWKFDKKASSSAKYGKLYDFVTEIIGDFLVEKSVASFHAELPGTFPQPLLDEMQGIVDGAKAANTATRVTMDRIITLNYGMDYLSTQVFGGGLVRKLQAWARAKPDLPAEIDALLDLLQDDFFEVPMFCDAFEGEARPVWCCGGWRVHSQALVFFASLTCLPSCLTPRSHWRVAPARHRPAVRAVVPARDGWVLPAVPNHVRVHAERRACACRQCGSTRPGGLHHRHERGWRGDGRGYDAIWAGELAAPWHRLSVAGRSTRLR